MHRDDRFGEKLATPDTSIADLIGEVDPIKVAEGRYLSDELTLHYGLVPRTNRGIFAINELPDLAERIQVGLLNVLEERDVQIRGYKIRLPLDVLLVASANPEDYTNRGRIITPLKDRFGSQIRTHYPLDVEHRGRHRRARRRGRSSADGVRGRGARRTWPRSWPTLSHLARASAAHQPALGRVGAPLGRQLETLVANATRRALRHGEREVVPRVSDLDALAASTAGKVEIETARGGPRRADRRAPRCKAAVLARVQGAGAARAACATSSTAFDEGAVVHTGEDVPSADYAAPGRGRARRCASRSPAWPAATSRPAVVASAVEFVLEGLHLSKRLNKDAIDGRATYRSRG